MANLEIASGMQGKSFILHVLWITGNLFKKKTSHNFEKNVITYKDENDLAVKIHKLKNDKKFSNQISKKSLRFINKFTWQKIKKEYLKIIKTQ